MKDLTVSNKMRWVAGGLYGLLCLYQMFLVKVILEGASPSNVYFTWLYAIVLVVGAAAMSVWMFYGKEALGAGARRAIVAGTVFCVAFELMTYTDQTDVINYTLYNSFPTLADNSAALYIIMVLRLLLMILAAFFVTSSRERAVEPELAEEMEDADDDQAEETLELDKAEEASDAAEAEETKEETETPAAEDDGENAEKDDDEKE